MFSASSASSFSFLTIAAIFLAGCGGPHAEPALIPVVAGEPVSTQEREELAVAHGFDSAAQLSADDWESIVVARNMSLDLEVNEGTAEDVLDVTTNGNWTPLGNFSECSCLDPSRVRNCTSPGVCWCAKKSGKFKFVTCGDGMAWCALYHRYRC